MCFIQPTLYAGSIKQGPALAAGPIVCPIEEPLERLLYHIKSLYNSALSCREHYRPGERDPGREREMSCAME